MKTGVFFEKKSGSKPRHRSVAKNSMKQFCRLFKFTLVSENQLHLPAEAVNCANDFGYD